jgi:hypothetical protein
MSGPFISVITTIRQPSASVHKLDDALREVGGTMVAVADQKGPKSFDGVSATLLTLEMQSKLPGELPRRLPINHYARKNTGYLWAIANDAQCIYDTDDDIAPNEYWRPRRMTTEAETIEPRMWANVFRMFTDDLVWPRGFPLNLVHDPSTIPQRASSQSAAEVTAPIQQSLSDRSPDVDAVWRLIMDHDVFFERRSSVRLPVGTWCPFNSQATWWWPEAYPLLYLPSHCSFRMTDIWRGFVAQRCLWELGHGLVFHAPDTIQERNIHDLMRDFQEELPGYQHNEAIVNRLQTLSLRRGPDSVGENLMACYEQLVADKFLPPDELPLLRVWLADIVSIGSGACMGWRA